MKRSAIIILILFVVFFWIGRHKSSPPGSAAPQLETLDSAPPLSVSPAAGALPPESPPLKKLPPIPASLAPESKPVYSPQVHQKQLKEKGLVEVKIVNGMALAQGDILLGKIMESGASQQGQVPAPEIRYWTRAEIPYVIQSDIPSAQKIKIEAALNYFKEKTPVRFIAYDGQPDALVFEVGNEHCVSALGKVGGLQPIRLDRNCGTHEVLHEIMHALGFPHEQSRTDRDRYVEILWNHIDPQYQDQFFILPEAWMAAVRDSPFDAQSVMMYPVNIFASAPELATMRSLTAQAIDPVTQGLSTEDIERLKRLFTHE